MQVATNWGSGTTMRVVQWHGSPGGSPCGSSVVRLVVAQRGERVKERREGVKERREGVKERKP